MTAQDQTPKGFIDSLPEDRRSDVRKLRATVRKHLHKGFAEEVRWGMLCYEVPLRVEPDTYNGKPLMYAAIGSQKNHMALYLMGAYANEDTRKSFAEAWTATGNKLDMGKACIRFTSIDDVPLGVVGEAIEAYTAQEFAELVRNVRS